MLTDSEKSLLQLINDHNGLIDDNWQPISADERQTLKELVSDGYVRHKVITNYPNGGCHLYRITDKGKASLY